MRREKGSGGPLVPPLSSTRWRTWAPRADLAPHFGRESGSGPCLWARAQGGFASYGRWQAQSRPVTPGVWYDFRAVYRQEGVACERVSVVAMLTWLGHGPRGPEVRREYATALEERGGGWRALWTRACAPSGSRMVRVELVLRWTERGAVWWREVRLAPSKVQRRRIVRAAAVYDPTVWGTTVAENLRRTEAILDRAGAQHPDVICLTEMFPDRGVEKPLARLAEPVPGGPGARLLARKARQYSCYISGSIHEKEGGLFYNTAVLYDRRGRLAGKYRKVQLSLAEAEMGLTPGREFPVFETDFGKVGLLICWDHSFQETSRLLALQGAELLLLSIAGDGVPLHWETTCRARAMENALHLVGSLGLRGPSWIVGPDGRILASTHGGVALADCDLDARPESLFLSVGDTLGDHRSVYLAERREDAYGALLRGQQKSNQ